MKKLKEKFSEKMVDLLKIPRFGTGGMPNIFCFWDNENGKMLYYDIENEKWIDGGKQ